MHIGVLTHNYPRYPGDFSGTFVEALCDELARQGHRMTIWAPYDPAYTRALTYIPAAARAGRARPTGDPAPLPLCVSPAAAPPRLHALDAV